MMTWLVIVGILLVIDVYAYQAILTITRDWNSLWRTVARVTYWIPTLITLASIGYFNLGDPYKLSFATRTFLITGIFALYVSKLFAVVFLLIDDLVRVGKWVGRKLSPASEALPGEAITRSEFLSKTALVAASIPMGTMAFGILSGAHDYRVRRTTLALPDLPKAFDGITLGQLSDIHSGSFFNKTAVKGGVEMFMREKPDVIVFTGDLVNNEASEVRDYIDVFDKLRAPLGVFSVMGNHDYGDYKVWPSQRHKEANFNNLIAAHKEMGFRLLSNEHVMLEQGSDPIAIMGVENWGMGGFVKKGRLDLAHAGTQDAQVKILLSHDPSHWDAQVRPNYSDIDLTLSGHTHGFQFGIELGKIKWSPSQYRYKQWGGLYIEGRQHLYVNRGFGYLGYPGRVGMPPELTLITLKRS